MIIANPRNSKYVIQGWKKDGTTMFYGIHAAMAAAIDHRRPWIIDQHVEFYVVTDRNLDTFTPKAVAAGYAIAVRL